MNNFNPNNRTELIEVPTTNTGVLEFSLGSLPNLRAAKRIIKVEAFTVGQVPLTPSNKTTINATVFGKAFLVLITPENVEIRKTPLYNLSKQANGTEIPEMNCQQIDPEKSKIVIATTAALVATEAFLLQVEYERG